jgi:predicted dehydrogenase
MENKPSRRKFLKTAAFGAAGIMLAPDMIHGVTRSAAFVNNSDGDIRRIGFIGLGQQAMHLMNGFIRIPGVEVVAGADVYGIKRERFILRVNKYYQSSDNELLKKIQPEVYSDYHKILERKDINTVVIAVPDFWHAIIAIDACKAKKDIYLEKPLTFTIDEGKKLVKAVRKNKVVLAVGSQQRSDFLFKHAVKLVQQGKLGKIREIKACVGAPPKFYDLPEEPIPADLDWKAWLGPTPYMHYNSQLDPLITLNPEKNETIWAAWRWYKETGGGFTTDWGAHVFDIAQWALGMDNSGPVKIIPPGVEGAKYLTYIYENGTVMTEEPWDEKENKGCKFIGENGWIEVARSVFNASNPEWMPDKNKKEDGVPYETSEGHYENFLSACRKRTNPIVPVEIGHRSCTVCNLGNIAYELNRSLQWNPGKQQFVNDKEADAKMKRDYANGFSL